MTLPRSTANYNYSHNIAYKLFFLFFQVSVPLLLLVFISAIPYMYFCSIFYFMHACVCSSQTIIVPWKFLTISVMFHPLLHDYSMAIIESLQWTFFQTTWSISRTTGTAFGQNGESDEDLACIHLRNCPKKQFHHTLSLRQLQNTQIMDKFWQPRVFSVQW